MRAHAYTKAQLSPFFFFFLSCLTQLKIKINELGEEVIKRGGAMRMSQ